MSSISSNDSTVSLESSNSIAVSSGSSLGSMNTRDHNELYDHRQHPDFSTTIENQNIARNTNSDNNNSTSTRHQYTNMGVNPNNNTETVMDPAVLGTISHATNNTATIASNQVKLSENVGVHHQTKKPHVAFSNVTTELFNDTKSPVIPLSHRYRRHSHQSYLGPPILPSFYQNLHGKADPVIEAAELAAHQFSSIARPSRLEHCIKFEGLSLHHNSADNGHGAQSGTTVPTNYTSLEHKDPLFNIQKHRQSSGRRLSKIHSTIDSTSPKMNKKKNRSNSVSSTRNFSENSNTKTNQFSADGHITSTNIDSNNESTLKLVKTKSSDSNNGQGLHRKTTRGSYDSDDSQGSRDTQETEEDVCFPMEPQSHSRINGIDFDELEEFAQHTRQMKEQYLESTQPSLSHNNNDRLNGSTSSSISLPRVSSAALRYTPRPSAQQPASSSISNSLESKRDEEEETEKISYVSPLTDSPGVQFDTRNRIEGEDLNKNGYQYHYFNQDYTPTGYSNNNFVIPNRFSFFCSDSEETIHTTDIASLVAPGQSFYDLFRGGEPTWWLDCSCPTDDEMRCIAKAFGIHPLTAEDIRIQETREKVELFKSYYFVCFHTFENDKESEDFLEPINVYIVVFRNGILTFHFGPISHCASVRRRVRQLRDYVDVNSDWLCYALIDDITDSFAPVIQSIEYEADVIEDSVFMARDVDFSAMLQRIGESRRKTMTLMRLLSGKADVIKMFAKRCQEEANGIGPALTSDINIANLHAGDYSDGQRVQPRGDIAMYLGDIQDHLLTMYQNLAAYEKIFSRSHTNYLAQLQVESFHSNNKVTDILGKVTLISTVFVPLNLITGLFGMNVKVPGEDTSIAWWFGILGVLIVLAIGGSIFGTYWIGRFTPPTTLNEAAESGATSVIPSIFGRGRGNKRRNHTDLKINPTTGSINSLPSRLSRYK